jgi:hypothetical protein
LSRERHLHLSLVAAANASLLAAVALTAIGASGLATD